MQYQVKKAHGFFKWLLNTAGHDFFACPALSMLPKAIRWPCRWLGWPRKNTIYFLKNYPPHHMIMHEVTHFKQYERFKAKYKSLGLVAFFLKWMWYTSTRGYNGNPLEIEAMEAERQ